MLVLIVAPTNSETESRMVKRRVTSHVKRVVAGSSPALAAKTASAVGELAQSVEHVMSLVSSVAPAFLIEVSRVCLRPMLTSIDGACGPRAIRAALL